MGQLVNAEQELCVVYFQLMGYVSSLCLSAAEFSQEVRHAKKDPHHQEVWTESQQGQRVQKAGVQTEVTHWQQAAQVLLDHPLPRPNAARSRGEEEREV